MFGKKSKGSKIDASFSKSKRKQKESESSISKKTESEDNSNSEPPKSWSKEEGDSENGDNHSRRMNEREKHLETIANQSNLQEVGVVRLYSTEWDVVPYPTKFKALTLQTFDDKGSPNQHIYYFKS